MTNQLNTEWNKKNWTAISFEFWKLLNYVVIRSKEFCWFAVSVMLLLRMFFFPLILGQQTLSQRLDFWPVVQLDNCNCPIVQLDNTCWQKRFFLDSRSWNYWKLGHWQMPYIENEKRTAHSSLSYLCPRILSNLFTIQIPIRLSHLLLVCTLEAAVLTRYYLHRFNFECGKAAGRRSSQATLQSDECFVKRLQLFVFGGRAARRSNLEPLWLGQPWCNWTGPDRTEVFLGG